MRHSKIISIIGVEGAEVEERIPRKVRSVPDPRETEHNPVGVQSTSVIDQPSNEITQSIEDHHEDSRSQEGSSEPEYAFDKIVDHKTQDGKRYYKVRWEGYTSGDDTWEPEEHLPKNAISVYNRKALVPRWRKRSARRH